MFSDSNIEDRKSPLPWLPHLRDRFPGTDIFSFRDRGANSSDIAHCSGHLNQDWYQCPNASNQLSDKVYGFKLAIFPHEHASAPPKGRRVSTSGSLK